MFLVIGVIIYLAFGKKTKGNNTLISHLILGLLIFQFILGMLINLYVTIPKVKPYTVFHHFGLILFHADIGLTLLSLSILFFINTLRKRKSIILGLAGTIFILIAFMSGIVFVLFGTQNIFSLTMAIGFIGSILIYAYAFFSASFSNK